MEAKYVNERKQFIKNRRLLLGKTLEDIGKAVGVSKTTVMRWESGDIANMRRDKIDKLAEALDTTPAVLLGWESSPEEEKAPAPERDEREREIMEIFEKLPDKEKEKFVQLARLLAKE